MTGTSISSHAPDYAASRKEVKEKSHFVLLVMICSALVYMMVIIRSRDDL